MRSALCKIIGNSPLLLSRMMPCFFLPVLYRSIRFVVTLSLFSPPLVFFNWFSFSSVFIEVVIYARRIAVSDGSRGGRESASHPLG